jgi:hypothetical protein
MNYFHDRKSMPRVDFVIVDEIDLLKSDGQIAHETFHAAIEAHGHKSHGGWVTLPEWRKNAWVEAAKAIRDKRKKEELAAAAYRVDWRIPPRHACSDVLGQVVHAADHETRDKLDGAQIEIEKLRDAVAEANDELSETRQELATLQVTLARVQDELRESKSGQEFATKNAESARKQLGEQIHVAAAAKKDAEESRRAGERALAVLEDLIVKKDQFALFDVKTRFDSTSRAEDHQRDGADAVKASIEFNTPFECVQFLGALAKMATSAPVEKPQFLEARPAVERVAYEVCAGILRRNMIDMIKRHRELTGFGLKESKDAIEASFGAQEWIVKGVLPT